MSLFLALLQFPNNSNNHQKLLTKPETYAAPPVYYKVTFFLGNSENRAPQRSGEHEGENSPSQIRPTGPLSTGPL